MSVGGSTNGGKMAGARPEDVASPIQVVHALYDSLSGPAEKVRPRDWDRLRSLLRPDARFLIVRWIDEDGTDREVLKEWSVDAFIEDARGFYQDTGFWETEMAARIETFGNVAHVRSSYESRMGSPESEVVGRGINSFQLVRHEGRWWLWSTTWDVEVPGTPIPEALT